MKNRLMVCSFFMLAWNCALSQSNNGTVSKPAVVSVKQRFSLVDIEMKPLTGKLKEYQDDYLKKNNVNFVPPSRLPQPLVSGKPVDLTEYYKGMVTQLKFPESKQSFRDTIKIHFYLDTLGNVKVPYGMDEASVVVYKDLLTQTNGIKKWTPAYFGSNPGQIAGSIEIVISGNELK